MKKLQLDLSDLRVDAFAPDPEGWDGLGTVAGVDSAITPYDTSPQAYCLRYPASRNEPC